MFSSFLEWLFGTVNTAVSGVAAEILTSVGADMTTLETTFPALSVFTDTMRALGLVFLFIIFCCSMIVSYSSPIFGSRAAGNPISIIIKTLAAGIGVILSVEICKTVLTYVMEMQQMLLDTLAAGQTYPELNFSVIIGGGIAGATGAFALVALILLLIFAYNYLQVIIQLLQRYCYLGILTYTSPLAFAMAGSPETSGIFWSWVKMYFGQCALVLLSTWGVEIMLYTGSHMSGAGMVQFLLMLVMLKSITQFETILNKLNINVAPSGSGFIGEMLLARPLISGAVRGIGGLIAGKAGRSGAKTTAQASAAKNNTPSSMFGTTDAKGNTSTPKHDAKVMKTSSGPRLSHNSADTSGQYKMKASTVAGGIVGRDIDGTQHSMLTRGGGYGVFRNVSDSLAASRQTSAVVRERAANTAAINQSIDRVNSAMSDSGRTVAAQDISRALNIPETNSNIELVGTFTHPGRKDEYMIGMANITDNRGLTREEVVAISLDGAQTLPGFFNTSTYTKIGDTGARVYMVQSRQERASLQLEDSYQNARNEVIETNQAEENRGKTNEHDQSEGL